MSSIEQVEKFWDARPCNVRHSSKELGTKEYFDEVAAKRYFVEPHITEFANFDAWNGKEVLEIGCGIGTDTVSFAKSGAKVTAIDLSSKSIDIAKKRAEVLGLQNNITFLHGSAEDLPSLIGNKKYDLIYSFGVIHHTPHPEKVYEQIASHLKDEGEFRVMVYNKISWRVLEILFESGNPITGLLNLDKTIASRSEAQTGCPVTFSYSMSEFAKLINGYGLVSEKNEIRHIFRWNVDQYVKGKYKKKLLWKMLPESFFNFLQKTVGWHLCVVAKKR